jgi:hypothetical protein
MPPLPRKPKINPSCAYQTGCKLRDVSRRADLRSGTRERFVGIGLLSTKTSRFPLPQLSFHTVCHAQGYDTHEHLRRGRHPAPALTSQLSGLRSQPSAFIPHPCGRHSPTN